MKRTTQKAVRIRSEHDPHPEAGYFPSEEARARWLFDFLQTDFGRLTAGQLLGLRKDAFGFVGAAVIEATEKSKAVSHGREADQWEYVYGHTVSAEELSQLQGALRAGWERLHEGNWWVLNQPIKYGIRRTGTRLVRGHRQGAFTDLFLAAAFDVIQASWDRLHACPRCGAVFLKVGKQQYCSTACSQETRWERFVSKSKRGRDYRAERTRAARKRTGANVRLGNRRAT